MAALVLIVEPGRPRLIDPDLVAAALGLTPAEAQVAAWLAAGKSVAEMAEATGCTNDAIRWHLKQIYQKQSVSRQVDLARLVLSVAELGLTAPPASGYPPPRSFAFSADTASTVWTGRVSRTVFRAGAPVADRFFQNPPAFVRKLPTG